jgi:molybdate transport system substrate-binding protein
MSLKVLSAGAARGVVTPLGAQALAEWGCAIEATFGAVGAMKALLLSGTPADLVILTEALIAELVADGHVALDTCATLGIVRTGVAVRAGDPYPDVSTPSLVRTSLLAAQGLYFPDPQRATAGIHFARVVDTLGIRDNIEARMRRYPDGVTAMRALAGATGERLIGVTQITEIHSTPGVVLVGPLPGELGLATTYSLGVCCRAASPSIARRFAALLAGESSRALRASAGFEI